MVVTPEGPRKKVKRLQTNRVVFTGTGKRYLKETMSKKGEFILPGEPYVFLHISPISAMGYAAQRSAFYDDSPVVLVVDRDKLYGDVLYDGVFRTRALNPESFLPYELSLDVHGRCYAEDYCAMLDTADRIIEATPERVRRKVLTYVFPSTLSAER